MVEDKLVKCNRCGGDACYKHEVNGVELYSSSSDSSSFSTTLAAVIARRLLMYLLPKSETTLPFIYRNQDVACERND